MYGFTYEDTVEIWCDKCNAQSVAEDEAPLACWICGSLSVELLDHYLARKAKMDENNKKECLTKKCTRYMVVIATNGAYCTRCGQKLKAVSVNDPRPISMFDGDMTPAKKTNGAALTVVGQPGQQEEMIERKHSTLYTEGAWRCWCGYSTNNGQMAGDHDKLLPSLVPKSKLYESYPLTQAETKPAQSDDWSCSPDISGCPLMSFNYETQKTRLPRIEIPYEMWKKWCYWARRFDTEWLAYLIGEEIAVSDDAPLGGWRITDLHIPKQHVTGAHVRVDEESIRSLPPGVIGDVHSHVRMQAFFSGEDIAHFNYPIHLVVNAREEFDSSIRVPLECGRTTRIKGRLMLIGAPDEPDWEGILKSQFIEPPKPASASGPVASSGGYCARDDSNQPTRTIGINSSGFGHVRPNPESTWKV